MHESSVALSLVEVARDVLREHGAARATSLTVRVGAWSSVVPAALAAAFPAAAEGTPLAGAHLKIVSVSGVGECPQHGAVTLETARGLRCPICGAPTPRLLEGDELELDELELDELELDGLELDGLELDGPELDRPEPDAPESDGPERA